MEVPTLTKKQIKSTLSMKKTKAKQVIKNVLPSPYSNTFWPELSVEDEIKLNNILEKNLPRIKGEKINVPWKDLKNIPKADRKNFRKEYTERLNTKQPESPDRQGLILGINDVTKSLEKLSVSAVLIAGDIQPRLMVQHVIDQSILHKIPVLIVQKLRNLTKIYCGISCVILGFDKVVDIPKSSAIMVGCINELFTSITPPKDHINSIRSHNLIVSEEKKYESTQVVSDTDVQLAEKPKDSIYLKNTGTGSRAFIPVPRKEVESSAMDIDFIEVPHIPTKVGASQYRSLKVKRLKNDLARTKRKIKILKKVELKI